MAENLTDDQLRAQYMATEVHENIPVIIYIIVVILLGIVGNTAAILFYKKSAHRSVTPLLLVILSINDFISSLWNTVYVVTLCKPGNIRFGLMCNIIPVVAKICFENSGCLLLLIAIVRFFLVCRPGATWSFTVRNIKFVLIPVFIFSFLLGSAYCVIKTDVKIDIKVVGNRTIIGYFCRPTTAPELRQFVQVTHIIDLVTAATVIVTVVVLYALIWRTVVRQRRMMETHVETAYNQIGTEMKSIPSACTMETCIDDKELHVSSKEGKELDRHLSKYGTNITNQNKDLEMSSGCEEPVGKTTRSFKTTAKNRKGKRTGKKAIRNAEAKISFTMFMVTLVSLSSLLPYIIHLLAFPNDSSVIGKFLHFSFMLNSTLNPYVISIMNKEFRQFIKQFFCACFRCKPVDIVF